MKESRKGNTAPPVVNYDGHRRRSTVPSAIPMLSVLGDTVRPSIVPPLDMTKVRERQKHHRHKDPWCPPPLPSLTRSKSDLCNSKFAIPPDIQRHLRDANSFSGVLPNIDDSSVTSNAVLNMEEEPAGSSERTSSDRKKYTSPYLPGNPSKALGSLANSIGVALGPSSVLGSKRRSSRKTSASGLSSATRSKHDAGGNVSKTPPLPPIVPVPSVSATTPNCAPPPPPNVRSTYLPYITMPNSVERPINKQADAPDDKQPAPSLKKRLSLNNAKEQHTANSFTHPKRSNSVIRSSTSPLNASQPTGLIDPEKTLDRESTSKELPRRSKSRHHQRTPSTTNTRPSGHGRTVTVLGPTLWYQEQLSAFQTTFVNTNLSSTSRQTRSRAEIPPIFLPVCNGCGKCLLPPPCQGCNCAPVSLLVTKMKWTGYASTMSNQANVVEVLPPPGGHKRRPSNSTNSSKTQIQSLPQNVPPVFGVVLLMSDHELSKTDIERLTAGLHKMFDYTQKFSHCMKQSGYVISPGASRSSGSRRSTSTWYRLPSVNGVKTTDKVEKASIGSIMKRRDSWSEACGPTMGVLDKFVRSTGSTAPCLCEFTGRIER